MAGLSGNNRLPKDAQVIVSMLKEAGINDYEPRVVNQLLEFTYRYVTGILDEARVYAQHSKKKTVDLEDVKLASMMQLDRSFTTPPPRDMLMEVAKSRNSGALPVIKPHYGLRLPPDRHCLSACNYKLRTTKKPQMMSKPQTMQFSSTNRINTTMVNRGVNMKVSSSTGPGGMTMMSSLQPAQPLRTKVMSSALKPVIKLPSAGLGGSSVSTLPKIHPTSVLQTSGLGTMSLGAGPDSDSLKRKREPDDSGFDTTE